MITPCGDAGGVRERTQTCKPRIPCEGNARGWHGRIFVGGSGLSAINRVGGPGDLTGGIRGGLQPTADGGVAERLERAVHEGLPSRAALRLGVRLGGGSV